MSDFDRTGLTPEEIERMEREERRVIVEKQLEAYKAEVMADEERLEKRRLERKQARWRLYYILLALLVIGLVSFLVFKRDLIWG